VATGSWDGATSKVYLSVVLSATVLLAFWPALISCTPPKAATNSPLTLSKLKKGYVYLAELMPAHPLYRELCSLQAHINRLRGGAQLDIADDIGRAWESPVILGPIGIDYPMRLLGQRRQDWWENLPILGYGPTIGLPQDLEARLAWRQQQIQQQTAQKLRQAEAEESGRLAQLRIQAKARYQNELNNLDLELSVPDDKIQQKAAQRRQEIEQQITEELSREATRGEDRLQQLREKLKQQENQAVAKARQELLTRSQQRRSEIGAEEGQLRQQLQQGLEMVGEPPWLEDALAAGRRLPTPQPEEAEVLRDQAFVHWRAARREQLERLIAQRASLTRAIAAGTRSAARRVAWEENLDLRLLPDEQRHGSDMTNIIAQKLATLWSPHESTSVKRSR